MTTEQDWLASLGITDPATQQNIIDGQARLVVLDASAHLDWDWLLSFPVLTKYDGPASATQECDAQYSRAYWYFHGPSGTDPGVGPVSQILDTAGQLPHPRPSYIVDWLCNHPPRWTARFMHSRMARADR